jgi:hypothetical protein
VFGQFHGIVGDQPGDREAFFAESVRRWAAQVGMVPDGTIPGARRPRPQPEPAGAEAAINAQATDNSTSRTAKDPTS